MARSRELTLLDVIQAVSEVAENDQEIIATVVHLISSGQVRLCDEAIEAINHLVANLDAAAYSGGDAPIRQWHHTIEHTAMIWSGTF